MLSTEKARILTKNRIIALKMCITKTPVINLFYSNLSY
jgi:hypothetical protein